MNANFKYISKIFKIYKIFSEALHLDSQCGDCSQETNPVSKSQPGNDRSDKSAFIGFFTTCYQQGTNGRGSLRGLEMKWNPTLAVT